MLGLCVNQISVGEKVAGLSGDGGERCAQVVGNRAEQIGPQLLVLGQDRSRLFLLQVFLVFHSEGALPQDREEQSAFKGIHLLARGRDAYDPIYLFCGPDGQICAARIRKRLRPGARPLVVGQNPLGRLMLRCGGVFAFGKRIINRKDLRRVQLSLI